MPGVQADSVVVDVIAKYQQYERDFDRLIKKTETGMAKLRQLTEKPVSVNVAGSAGNADREAATVERATERKIRAKRKEVETEAQASARISAMVDRSIAAREREATAAERSASRIATAGSKALAARQTAAMRGGTALGGNGTMPAPTPAADKVNYFLRDQIDTQTRFNAAQAAGNREEATALRDQLTQFRLINQYKRAGLDETEATARAEERVADIARRRANRAASNPPVREMADSAPVRQGGGLGGAARTIRNLATVGIAGYGAIQGAREYLELTDAYKKYNAQLTLATMENGNLATAQTDVQRIATETRSGLGETAQLYATFQRNAAQLGLTQAETGRATEIITKSFKISGATAAEAAGGLRQFLQGLQSGTLRGEEFNSVVENAPRLAKIFADQLTGGNIGALRDLASEGKITGVEIKKALGDPAVYEQINKEFKRLPVTFEDAMVVVKNAATITFGAFDEGGEFSKALANFLTTGATGFGDLAKSASDSGIEIRAAFEGLGDAFAPLFAGAQAAFGGIRSEANYTRDTIASILSGIDQIRNIPANLQNQANAFDRRVFGGQFRADAPLANSSGTFLNSFNQSREYGQARVREQQLSAQFGARLGKDGKLNLNPFTQTAPRAPVAVNKDLAKFTALNADLEKLKATASGKELATINKKIAKNNEIIQNLNQGVSLAAARGAVTGGGRSGPSAETLENRRKAAAAKAQRLEDAYNSEVEGLNSDILSAKGKQAQTIEQTAQAAIDNANAELKERELKYQNQENEGKINDQQRLVLVGLAGQVRAQQILTANTEKAAALADQSLQILSDQQSNEADALRSQLDMTKSRAQRERLTQQLLEKEYEARRTALAAQLQTATERGDVAGQLDAEGKLRNLPGQQAAEEFRNREDNKSPYQKYRENLTNADSLSDEIDNIKIEVLDQVADSLANATTKALGLTGALGDIVGQIIKIGIQRKLIGPLADSLFGKADGSTSGGLGNILSSIFQSSSGGRASGGDVSAGKVYRINENGPEYFQPAMSGKIIPTGRAASGGGGMSVTQYISVDGRNSVTPAGFANEILSKANRYAASAASQAGKSAYDNSPNRAKKLQQLGS